jgi:putative nucleotidyltransferase with HDIG domain
MDFLNTLTSETAIAVDNAQLFRDLERSNLDLAVAYETTLEGWAKTLELRDRETEGHSQRVMDLTLRMSRRLGIPEEELIDVQRGALLHDIGKMGVPDSILLKEGPLNDDEWTIMRQHPVFARNMLSAIPFLERAMEIPYSHHEKWDGSGYPQGLKGEEIPLAARIFAVVDVWDALRSDRPYRKAWSDEEALEEIIRSSGSHFDPTVVKVFLDIVKIDQRDARKK